MARTRCILFFLLILSEVAFAQKAMVSAPVSINELIDFQGIEADGYLIIKGVKSSESNTTLFFVITPNKEVLASSTIKGSFEIIGSSFTFSDLTVYFASSLMTKEVHSLTLVKNTRTLSFKKIRVDHAGFLCYLSFDSKFHLLRENKKTRSLCLDSYSDTKKTDSLCIPITDKELFRQIISTRSRFSKEDQKPVFIREGLEIPFDGVRNQNKIYYRNQRLWLVMDDVEGKKDLANTLVCELDFVNQKFKKTLVTLTAEPKVDHNSFLYKDTLFTLSISKDYLAIDLFDLKSLNKLDKIVYLKGQKITFKKSRLIDNEFNQEIENGGGDLAVSNYVFHFMSIGTPVISVSSAGPNYLLLIGNYQLPVSRVNTSAYTPGRPNTVTGGINNNVGVVPPSVPPKKVYFYGYLTKKGLRVPAENFETFGRLDGVQERLGYLELEHRLGGECIISAPERAYFVYLNLQTSTLHVEEF